MKQTLKQEFRRHRLILIFSAVSLLLLIIFLVFQHNDMTLLKLDVKWLILSSIPILIGLFIGGYIKNFKGFGLELEYNLKESIPLSLITKSEFKKSEGINKESVQILHQLDDKERKKTDRLKFIFGKSNHYYNIEAVDEHFRFLSNLRFIEIVDENDEFLYLIPISSFKKNNQFNLAKIDKFIKAIEKKKIKEDFPEAISDNILLSDNIIEAYKKFKKSGQTRILANNKDILPILDTEKKMLGTIEKQKLEAKIAEEVERTID